MQDLTVSFIQADLFWEDKERNLSHFESLLSRLREPTDLVILPEMFNTGFSMNVTQLAEPMNCNTMKWMAKTASRLNAVVCGSLIIEEDGAYYNRLIWMKPDGTFFHYDKRHLFSLGKEDHYFTAGKHLLIVHYKGWKICPLICYDLRFPVWCRNVTGQEGGECLYDFQFFIANWPEKRRYAWRMLLPARAIENQAYVLGVNRVGEDGNGIYHTGDSTLIDPLGEIIYTKQDEEVVKTFTLSGERLKIIRSSYPFLTDSDRFSIADRTIITHEG